MLTANSDARLVRGSTHDHDCQTPYHSLLRAKVKLIAEARLQIPSTLFEKLKKRKVSLVAS